MAVNVYTGDIQIEDADFDLTANQFIVRDDEFSLAFSGVDEFGSFKIEGVATKSEAGFYMAPKLKLNYLSEAGSDTASIRLDTVKLSPKENKCFIKGVWIQDGESWGFSANLNLSK